MDNIFAIKEEFKTTIVGFNNSGLPLGERDDLDKLALMAQHDPHLAQYFVQLPTADQIKDFQSGKFLTATEENHQEPEITPEASHTEE